MKSGPKLYHYIPKKKELLSQILMRQFRKTEEEAKKLIELGSVFYEKLRFFYDEEIPQGKHLRLYLNPKRFDVDKIDWKGSVLSETADYLVVNKPSGIPTVATVDNAKENVLEMLRLHLKTELFVTQRLDTPTSGVLLFAKTKEFQEKFNSLLREDKMQKTYKALTRHSPPIGKLTHWMDPQEKTPRRLSPTPKQNWLKCELEVKEVKKVTEDAFESTILLITGRTHQIRSQLGSIGCPIVGDTLYGSKEKQKQKGKLPLTAFSLAFRNAGPFQLSAVHWDGFL